MTTPLIAPPGAPERLDSHRAIAEILDAQRVTTMAARPSEYTI